MDDINAQVRHLIGDLMLMKMHLELENKALREQIAELTKKLNPET